MPSNPIRVGQSADPDDAFMAWGLQQVLAEEGIDADLEFADIETLNLRALAGEIELTAISVGAYPAIQDRYRLLRSGASFGADYGPVVIATEPPDAPDSEALAGKRIAIPGEHTTAALLLRIYGGKGYEAVPRRFDEIVDAVLAGEVDAGLVIHEGQMTYSRLGLHALLEPARQWHRQEGLPLPLGAVAVRRDLPEETQRLLADAFGRGVHRSFENRGPALDFAAEYGRDLDRQTLEEYVDRFVDAATLDMGETGLRALRRLFELAESEGVLDCVPALDPL